MSINFLWTGFKIFKKFSTSLGGIANLIPSINFLLSEINLINHKNRKIILVLGDMLELGSYGVAMHKELGRYISNLNFIDTIYGFGDLIKNTINSIDNCRINKKHFLDDKLLVDNLKNQNQNCIYYFKGSRSMYIEKIISKVFDNVVWII